MVTGGARAMCMSWHMFPGLVMCCADPAQPLITAGGELDDLSVDRWIMICLSEVWYGMLCFRMDDESARLRSSCLRI